MIGLLIGLGAAVLAGIAGVAVICLCIAFAIWVSNGCKDASFGEEGECENCEHREECWGEPEDEED